MSIIDQINQETNSFYDANNLIEYLFVGWERILSVDEKCELILKLGKPRSKPIEILFETDALVVSNPYPKIERQMIYREPLDQPLT